MKNIDPRVIKLYQAFSTINQDAYKNLYLLSNSVLSKNPFCCDILDFYLSRKPVPVLGIVTVLKKLCSYYLKSIAWFCIYVLKQFAFFFSKFRFQLNDLNGEFIVIDNYFSMKEILDNESYKEKYFPRLESVLQKLKKRYAFVPVIYGPFSPIALYRTLNILYRNNVPVLTEFQLLKFVDFLSLFRFLIMYPIHVLLFSGKMKPATYEYHLIKYQILNNLDELNIQGFSRFLYGRRIAKLSCSNIQCISWYENQILDKNLYRGLREGTGNVRIYGAQLLLKSNTMLYLEPDETETRFNTVPDIILVNGSSYLPGKKENHFRIGPSLRYARLFRTRVHAKKNNSILVLLPHSKHEIENILQLIRSLPKNGHDFWIKFYPWTLIDRYKWALGSDMTVVDEDLYELFKHTRIVVGTETGALVEAATLGIPAIVIDNKEKVSHNPFPELGRGLIWDKIQTDSELSMMIRRFDRLLLEKTHELSEIAGSYREMFFCEPTEKKIMEAFDL